jgi:hypothetical protein
MRMDGRGSAAAPPGAAFLVKSVSEQDERPVIQGERPVIPIASRRMGALSLLA